MSKGLEALERIGKQKTKDTSFGVDIETNCNEDYQIIEKALKRLEELEKAFDSLVKENEKIGKMLSKEIEKNVQEVKREPVKQKVLDGMILQKRGDYSRG